MEHSHGLFMKSLRFEFETKLLKISMKSSYTMVTFHSHIVTQTILRKFRETNVFTITVTEESFHEIIFR